MKRSEAIKKIMSEITDELVVTTTGYISREVYRLKDRPENFYMCGSMGCALPVGLGLALNTDKKVVVIDGDGSALMSLSSMVVSNYLKLKNIRHIILNNGIYASTGGQCTCSRAVNFKALEDVEVIQIEPEEYKPPRIDMEPEEILSRFMKTIQKKKRK